jgi:hypothetical protein
MALRDELAAQRHLLPSRAELDARIARAITSLASPEAAAVDAALAGAAALLDLDPYHLGLHRALGLARARRGELEAAVEHLAVGVDMEVVEPSALRVDPELVAVVATADRVALVDLIVEGARARRRIWDLTCDALDPPGVVVLRWRAEDDGAVRAIVDDHLAHCARVVGGSRTTCDDRYMFDGAARTLELGEDTFGKFGYLGRLHAMLRALAPHVEDLRFLLFEQTVSPLDEIWIVEGAFHVRRHHVAPGFDHDLFGLCQVLDDFLVHTRVADPDLRRYVVGALTELAEAWWPEVSKRSPKPYGIERVEFATARLAAHGRPELRARYERERAAVAAR